MKIILSPAKKMIVDTDNLAPVGLPVYIDKTAEVLNWMKSKSKEELAALVNLSPTHMRCNRERLEKLLQEVFMGNLNLVIRKANRM